jgi:hypothetical protein
MTPQLSHSGVAEKLETPGAVVQKVEAVPLKLWADAALALSAETPATSNVVNIRFMTPRLSNDRTIFVRQLPLHTYRQRDNLSCVVWVVVGQEQRSATVGEVTRGPTTCVSSGR